MKDNGTDLGTTYKLAVSIEGIEPLTMDDIDFSCRFWTWQRAVVIPKSGMLRLGAGSYVAVFDSSLVGRGTIKVQTTARIPDAECPGGFRTEIYTEETGIRIN